MEAIILAGGQGTRLRSEVADIPKSMAPIYGKPFLEYQMEYLYTQGVRSVVMSVGYLAEYIIDHFGAEYRDMTITYAIEKEPLGTGGAIAYAMEYIQEEDAIIVNGDSLFEVDIAEMMSQHKNNRADVSIALKPMQDFDRYGIVQTDESGRVTDFKEKQFAQKGNINGGLYIFSKNIWDGTSLSSKFSLENDFFTPYIKDKKFYAYISEAYFLDIGIPEDYYRAQYEIGIFPAIDKTWTLFLDRDGVLNEKRENDYVKNLDELILLPEAIRALPLWTDWVGRIVVVTNQQGIGKGLMTETDLEIVHSALKDAVEQNGAKIDAIYYAPQLASENSKYRKPQIGMAELAQIDFPEIDLHKSIMVGDSLSDIEFALKAGMQPVYICPKPIPHAEYYACHSLSELTEKVHTCRAKKIATKKF